MKAAFIFLFVLYYVECRKTYVPLDKNANIAFINMEGGGGVKPGSNPQLAPAKSQPTPAKNNQSPSAVPTAQPVTAKAIVTPAPTPAPVKPTPAAPKPYAPPSQIKPIPVNPAPVAKPITTPGPGTVKQLVNFYDSQGKGSPIRPYSYSQAVKQG